MELAIIIGTTLGAVVLVLLIVALIDAHSKDGVPALEARRAALKEVVELTRARQDVAVYMAPEGDLTVGLVRARAIHDIEMEVRDLLARVGKP